MLNATHRLRYRKDFDDIFSKGQKVYGTGLGLRFRKRFRPELTTRFGFIVGTKVSKEAVVRNKLKRQMRESVRLLLASVASGFDVVITAFPEAKPLTYLEISAMLKKMLAKAGILKV